MDSNFYIASPDDEQAQKVLPFAGRQVATPIMAIYSFALVSTCLGLGAVIWTSPTLEQWPAWLWFGFAASLMLPCGSYLSEWYTKRRSVRRAQQCLKDGLIVAVPREIKIAFEDAARLRDAEGSHPFWQSNFYRVKDLLPLVSLLRGGSVEHRRKAEAVLKRHATEAATEFNQRQFDARTTQKAISDAEAELLLGQFRKPGEETPS